jgi:hypothetical protein
MKNLFVSVFLLSTITLFGQEVHPTQKGNLMVGGSGNISYYTQIAEGASGYLSMGISPSIGWFLSDGLALGVGPTFQISRSFGEAGSTSLGLGTDVFLVKYFGGGIFIKGSTGYSLSHFSTSSSEYDYDFTIHNFNIVPVIGYAFFLRPNVALELSLGNTFNIRLSDGSASYYSTASVGAGFQIFL